jgi:hypothetical protein
MNGSYLSAWEKPNASTDDPWADRNWEASLDRWIPRDDVNRPDGRSFYDTESETGAGSMEISPRTPSGGERFMVQKAKYPHWPVTRCPKK